jgi:hypothetical protein
MTRDLERIPGVGAAAVGNIGDELTFSFPEVLGIIRLCSENEIAVLGVEVFVVKQDGHYASGCSDYDLDLHRKWLEVQPQQWQVYVNDNNRLAEIFVRQNPLGDDHVYILTTSPWREFQQIH